MNIEGKISQSNLGRSTGTLKVLTSEDSTAWPSIFRLHFESDESPSLLLVAQAPHHFFVGLDENEIVSEELVKEAYLDGHENLDQVLFVEMPKGYQLTFEVTP